MRVFATALAAWGAKTNLTARPGDPLELVFHLGDSLMPLALARSREPGLLRGTFDDGQTVLDVGSGAGFPGLVLAAATDATFTLVESRQKRASFLRYVAGEMGLANVAIEMRRLAPGDHADDCDVVTTRALGASVRFLAIAEGALRKGGIAILYASATQRLDDYTGGRAGLTTFQRYSFELQRRDEVVRRALLVWRK
jgi:16S rRNA (guanine527-N7)-methyltransferase